MSEFAPEYDPSDEIDVSGNPEDSNELPPTSEDRRAIEESIKDLRLETSEIDLGEIGIVEEAEEAIEIDDQLKTRLANEGISEQNYLDQQRYLKKYAQKLPGARGTSTFQAPGMLGINEEGHLCWLEEIHLEEDPGYKPHKETSPRKTLPVRKTRDLAGNIREKSGFEPVYSNSLKVAELPEELRFQAIDGQKWQLGQAVKVLGSTNTLNIGRIAMFFNQETASGSVGVMFRDYAGRPNVYLVPYNTLEIL